MLQYKALQQAATQPPQIMGVETAGPTFAAARRFVWRALEALGSKAARAQAICVWGDVTAETELSKMEDIVPGGDYWKKKERKLHADFSWVHNPTAATPLFYHERDEPLFVFHVADAQWTLELDVVKGCNFLNLFPIGSPERVRSAPRTLLAPLRSPL